MEGIYSRVANPVARAKLLRYLTIGCLTMLILETILSILYIVGLAFIADIVQRFPDTELAERSLVASLGCTIVSCVVLGLFIAILMSYRHHKNRFAHEQVVAIRVGLRVMGMVWLALFVMNLWLIVEYARRLRPLELAGLICTTEQGPKEWRGCMSARTGIAQFVTDCVVLIGLVVTAIAALIETKRDKELLQSIGSSYSRERPTRSRRVTTTIATTTIDHDHEIKSEDKGEDLFGDDIQSPDEAGGIGTNETLTPVLNPLFGTPMVTVL